MKRVLMIAYHFPPLAGSSGIQRTLRFVQQLPNHGWQPVVLTATPRAYERVSNDLMAEIPADTVVRRAFALDTARHLSVSGRYVGAWARPDRWASWRFDAVRQGMALIRRYSPDAIWSTFPIATAHQIGAALHQRSGLPWIADFRDPMAQADYPSDPLTWQSYQRIEAHAAQTATWCCFTTPGATRIYRERYPHAAERIQLVENGYDSDSFEVAERQITGCPPLNAGCVTLLHSGLIYPIERDPTQLFSALAHMRQTDPATAAKLRLRFRAAVHNDLLLNMARQFGVSDLVEVLPPVPYTEALQEMLRADVLMILQASNCNEQIPAKLYEYLRAGRPIACLSDAAGDTWTTLQRSGVQTMAQLDNAHSIESLLQLCANGDTETLTALPQGVAAGSRVARSAELAALLDRCLPVQQAASLRFAQ